MDDASYAVQVNSASKSYSERIHRRGMLGSLRDLFGAETKPVTAVSNVSFEIKNGEAVGYLGLNGAGKSTMMKMLTGILVPTNGAVFTLGKTPHLNRHEVAREVGVVFGQRTQLWWDLPVRDSFELHRRIYKTTPRAYRDRLDMLVQLLELGSLLDRPPRQLSLGQRMRSEIAISLLHRPKLLLLDEPTIGLDVIAKDIVRKFLREINRTEGVTIVLTTHDLQDIESVCPRLLMVHRGELAFDGGLGALRERYLQNRVLTLRFDRDPGPVAVPGGVPLADQGLERTYTIGSDITLLDVIDKLDRTLPIVDVALQQPSTEDIVRDYLATKRSA